MTAIRVVVCLPAEPAAGELEGAVDRALAPFAMYSGVEWREIWDSWTVRGGSDGTGFRVVPGHGDDPRLVHDMPRYTGEPLPSLPGMCAGGPRGLLDPSPLREQGPWDLLTLDGWWIEGRRPVHADCDSPAACPHLRTGRGYAQDLVGYLERLAPDVFVVKLRCHG